MASDQDLRERILEAVQARQGSGVRRSELRREVDCHRGADAQRFREVFRDLCAEGILLRQRGGRYVQAVTKALVAGTIQVNGRGFGFVTRQDGGTDIFIPPPALLGAISGDRVLVALTDQDDERGPVGEVRRITERRHRVLVASLVELPSGPAVRPLRRELPAFVDLADGGHAIDPADVDPGDWVEVSLLTPDSPQAPLQAVLLRRLGGADPISADLDAIVAEFGLPEPWSAAEEQAAARLEPVALERVDATALEAVTIDPLDAQDFDDALSITPGPQPGLVTIGVHIADVAAYVPADSAFDAGARARGFTAYLPGRTLPMLPAALAGRTCSLIAGEERLAHSVFMDIDAASGEVVSRRRQRTRIRVVQRLTFEDVAAVLADHPAGRGRIPPRVHEIVRHLGEVARACRTRRAAQDAFLDLALPEIRVLCTGAPPRIQALQRVEAGPAHQLVEEFMLAANTAVAEELLERGLPGLFRNHDEPKPADLAAFLVWARQTLHTRLPALGDRAAVNRLLAEVAQDALRDTVLAQFLRALPRAGYGVECRGHYGLGKEIYCHFTSPIRRYPDLVVHQQLLALDLGRTPRGAADCDALGQACTSLEEQVDTATYAAVDRLKLRYLRQRQEQSPGEVYEGTVSRCSSDGLGVYLPEVGMVGVVPASRLPGGPYRLDRHSGQLRGSRGGKSYKAGDVIYVQCRRADTVRGELHLEPVQARV